jgi:hypothetical protein
MEAINSLPGNLSPIIHNNEESASQTMGAFPASMQSGLNVMSNLSGMSQNVQQQVCNTCGISKNLYDKILAGDPSVSNEQIEDTLKKLSIFSSISSSVMQAETSGTEDLTALKSTFQDTISSNINDDNFSKITENFFKLSSDFNTDLGSISDKLGGGYNSPQNIPKGVKSMYGIPTEVQPSEKDLLNRDMKSYTPVINNTSTENYKKATGFIYEFNNLKSRVNAMTIFSDSIKSIISNFGIG